MLYKANWLTPQKQIEVLVFWVYFSLQLPEKKKKIVVVL